MATALSDGLRGKASGWYNIGNLSGGGLSAGIAIWMFGHHVDHRIIAAVLGAMTRTMAPRA